MYRVLFLHKLLNFFYIMQTVLITGGTGLVGRALTHTLVQKGYRVIILTRDLTGKQAAKNKMWD